MDSFNVCSVCKSCLGEKKEKKKYFLENANYEEKKKYIWSD